ncbi:RidA family protein [Viscerimonas tarda]
MTRMNSLKRKYIYTEELDNINLTSSQSLIGVTAFVDAANITCFYQKKENILAYFREHFGNLPVSVVAQPADKGIALEIWEHTACERLVYKSYGGVNYSVYEDGAGKAVWGFGCAVSDPEYSFREQAIRAFDAMQGILLEEGFSMDNIVRQWNYIPNILKTFSQYNRTCQHYQLFNDIRQCYYGLYKRNKIYPAATGIGMDYGTVTIDFCAIQPHPHTEITGLNNPNQTAAYHYGQEVLVGAPLQENEQKNAPLFERAKSIRCPGHELIFVSGTASIHGENTVGQNDVVRQTIITIKNLFDLTDKEYTGLRVYVKYKKDMSLVKKVCEKYYRNILILCVKADICRNDLLVEIEGEAEIWIKE